MVPSQLSKRWYVSYAWGDETEEGRQREAAVDQLCDRYQQRRITIVRDKNVLGVGDRISTFMRELAQGARIFVFLSRKYLESDFCMFELNETWRRSGMDKDSFLARVRVFRWPDAQVRRPEDWRAWSCFWKQKYDALDRKGPGLPTASLGTGGFDALKQAQRNHMEIGDILAALADTVQAMTLDELFAHEFPGGDPNSADQKKRRAAAAAALAKILTRSDRAVRVIREHSGLCDGVDAAAADVAERLVAIAAPEVAARGLRDAYDVLHDDPARGENADIQKAEAVVVEAVQLLVTFQIDADLVEQIRERMVNQEAVIAWIPCALETVAEIYMAAFEERVTQYRLRRNEVEWPEGKKARPAPPITGINNQEEKLAAVREDLARKFVVGAWAGTRERIDDIMIESLASAGIGLPKTRAQNIRAAASELKGLRGDGRYYLACRMPTDEQARAELEAGLVGLKKDYPALMILGLTGDVETEMTEREQFMDFKHVLPREA